MRGAAVIRLLGSSIVAAAGLMLTGCIGAKARSQPRDTTQLEESRDSAAVTDDIDSAPITQGELALGDSVFNGRGNGGTCSPCHGPNGVGTAAAPSLRDDQWINGDGSFGFIKGTVYQGVPNPKQHPLPMPPFGRTLTDRQLQAVTEYVYSLKPRRGGF